MISEAQKRATQTWRERNPDVYKNYLKDYRESNPYTTTDSQLRHILKVKENIQLQRPRGAHAPATHEYENVC